MGKGIKRLLKRSFSNFFLIIISFSLLQAEQSFIDSLKFKLTKAENNDRLEILISLTESCLYEDDEACIKYADEAISLINDDHSQKEQKANLLSYKAYALTNLYRFQEAIHSNEDALKIYLDLQQKNYIAKAYYKIGNIYRIIGNYNLASQNLQSALSIFSDLNQKEDLYKTHYLLGAVCLFQNNYKKALEHNLISIEIMDSCEQIDKEFQAGALNQIGRSYEFQKNYQKALDYFQEALSINKEMGNDSGYSQTLHNIAMLYGKMEQPMVGIPYLKEAEQIMQKVNDSMGLAYTYQNLGILFYESNQYNKSADYFLLAIPLFRNLQVNYGLSSSLAYLSRDQLHLKLYRKAEINAKESLSIAEEMKMKGLIRDAKDILSEVYYAKKQYKEAYTILKESTNLLDSLFAEKYDKINAELQTKYETEKKEQENTILKQKNEFNLLTISRQKSLRNFLIIILLIVLISSLLFYNQYRLKKIAFQKLEKANQLIKQQRDDLDKMNRTRNQFFSIISHDLKNSFSSLKMGAELFENFQELDQNEMYIVGNEMGKSVDKLYRLLENLLEWSRLQINRIHHEPEFFDIHQTILEILQIHEKKISQKQISFQVKTEPCRIFADQNMIYSVMQNIISNAIKFSYPNGIVIISQKIISDCLQLDISDQGKGIPPERLKTLFNLDKMHSQKGTEGEKGTGLGLILCKEFLEKNNATIRIISNNGTSVIITLPLREEVKCPKF